MARNPSKQGLFLSPSSPDLSILCIQQAIQFDKPSGVVSMHGLQRSGSEHAYTPFEWCVCLAIGALISYTPHSRTRIHSCLQDAASLNDLVVPGNCFVLWLVRAIQDRWRQCAPVCVPVYACVHLSAPRPYCARPCHQSANTDNHRYRIAAWAAGRGAVRYSGVRSTLPRGAPFA